MCKISVILTSYNHAEYLEDSIRSVLNQTFKDYELIIVDDCSTDESWEIIEKYNKENECIKAIRHDYNWHGGVVEDTVRNYANGEYIAIHHSDDIWEPDKLEKQINVFYQHNDYGAVFTYAQAIDDSGNIYSDESGFYYNKFEVKNRSRYEWLNHFFYKGNCLCHPSILIKKSVYEEDGFFRKGLRQIPDFVKWIQVCKKYDIYVIPEALVKFRIHDNGSNESGLTRDKQVRSTVELFLMLDEFGDLTDKDEFLMIFPEAEKYCCKSFVPEYALGMICIQENLQPYTRLYGIMLLYHALNNEEKQKILKEEYNFTSVGLMDITGIQDIFGVIPENYEQTRTLYMAYDGQYSERDSIQKQFVIYDKASYKEVYKMFFEKGRIPDGIRFDPSERAFVRSNIRSIYINGIRFECEAQNRVGVEDGWDIFISQDPYYFVRECGCSLKDALKEGENVFEIDGELKRVCGAEISYTAMSEYYKMRDEIYDIQAKLSESQKQLMLAREELNAEKDAARNYLQRLESIEKTNLIELQKN